MSGAACSTHSLRSPWRRRKNCLLGLACILVGVYVWAQYVEMDAAFSPLRPLIDAESEARRLLAVMTHYNYQCNTTLSQVGNATLWPLCASRETGFSSDDRKVMYTIGTLSDYSLERTLAMNYSFEVHIVSRGRVSPSVYKINNTWVVHMAVVANDPADFSRNSYSQRTLNDLLESDGHASDRIDLLRLVASDHDLVQMWELVRYLIIDNVMLRVQQLHLIVYIEKLDDDYLYNWYRTLYELFAKSGLYLYHTSSHDPLCLQVTLMQSCVYFLAYIRNPGPQVFSMYPPADCGLAEQEWRRLIDYVNTVQVNCDRYSSYNNLHADNLWTACSKSSPSVPCHAIQFRQSSAWMPSVSGCQVSSFVPEVDTSAKLIKSYTMLTHISSEDQNGKLLTIDAAWRTIRGLGWLTVIDVDVPGYEWSVVEQLLDSYVLQNASRLLMKVRLPNPHEVGPTVLRRIYSQLRRVGSVGFEVFYSSDLGACVATDILVDSTDRKDIKSFSAGSEQCFRLGYLRSKFV